MAQGSTTTAETPMMDGLRLEMLQALESDDSCFTLAGMMPRLRAEAQLHGPELRCTAKASVLKDERCDMFLLLHHVRREVLRSVIRGTLAWDMCQTRGLGVWRTDDRTLPGAYVTSIAVKGRQGAFLTGNELRRLQSDVLLHAQAADHWFRHRSGSTPICRGSPTRWTTGSGGPRGARGRGGRRTKTR